MAKRSHSGIFDCCPKTVRRVQTWFVVASLRICRYCTFSTVPIPDKRGSYRRGGATWHGALARPTSTRRRQRLWSQSVAIWCSCPTHNRKSHENGFVSVLLRTLFSWSVRMQAHFNQRRCQEMAFGQSENGVASGGVLSAAKLFRRPVTGISVTAFLLEFV